MISAEESVVWAARGRDQRANTISSAWLSYLFGLIDRQTKLKPPWKNWPISTHAEWDLGIFPPYLLLIQPTHAEVWSFPKSLCSSVEGASAPQVKVEELSDAKTDPQIMEDLFASTYWECSLSHSGTPEAAWKPRNHTASHMRIMAGLSSTLEAYDVFLRHQKHLGAHARWKSRRQWD